MALMSNESVSHLIRSRRSSGQSRESAPFKGSVDLSSVPENVTDLGETVTDGAVDPVKRCSVSTVDAGKLQMSLRSRVHVPDGGRGERKPLDRPSFSPCAVAA